MLEQGTRKRFVELIARYRLSQKRCELKEEEILKITKRIGGYADSDKLAQVILAIPFESRLRHTLFRKYEELIEKTSGASNGEALDKKNVSLDKWTQDTLNRLAGDYKLLIDGKSSLQEEIFGLAKECGAHDNMETMYELISLIQFPCFLRFRFVHQYAVLRDRKQNIERPAFTGTFQQFI